MNPVSALTSVSRFACKSLISRLATPAVALVMAIAPLSAAKAVNITSQIANADFEALNLNGNAGAEQFSNNNYGGGWTNAVVAGSVANFGVQDPPTSFYGSSHPLPAPFSGNQFAFVNVNANTTLNVNSNTFGTLQADTLYTLRVAVGQRLGTNAGVNYQVGLVANGTEVATFASGTQGNGNILDLVYTLDSATVPTLVGQNLQVRVRSINTSGTQTNFDNVRLDATPVARVSRLIQFDLPSMGVNGNFEQPNLNGNSGSEQFSNANIGPGWTVTGNIGNFGVQDPANGFYGTAHPLPSPFQGNQIGFVNVNAGGSTNVDSAVLGTFDAGALYTLNVAVGERAGSGNDINYRIGLLANGVEVGSFALGNTTNGNILDLKYVLDTATLPAIVGQNLQVRISAAGVSGGVQANFDNVRLSMFIAIPEPATATLGLLSVAGLMLRRRRMA